MNGQFFTVPEAVILQRAIAYEQLSKVAISQLQRMRTHHVMLPSIICGPISNGGRGSIAANIEYFESAVNHWVGERLGNHFSQIPYEESIWRIRDADFAAGKTYPKAEGNPILELFYRPIFESGLIGSAKFLPGWETSDGARWERRLCEALGIHIFDLRDDFSVFASD